MLDKTAPKTTPATQVVISPPNFQSAKIRIVGTAPYVMNKMSSANRLAMMAKQESGEQSKKGQKRKPKDFDAVYKGAMHISQEGWHGIPASSFRAAMISACRVSGFQMTKAKLCIFVEADGIDEDDGQPLIKIHGKPKRRDMAVKLADGSTDIIARPFFDQWHADVTFTWDADMFSASDVINLLARAGRQVGIGSGRPDSKTSTGMGWGVFRVES
jgi:hypothetical protein